MKGDDAEAVGCDLSDLLWGCEEAQERATQPCRFIIFVIKFILLNPKNLICKNKKFIDLLAHALEGM